MKNYYQIKLKLFKHIHLFIVLLLFSILHAQNLHWDVHDVGNVTQTITNVWSHGNLSIGGFPFSDVTCIYPKGSTSTYQITQPSGHGGDFAGLEPTIGAMKNDKENGPISVTSSGSLSCNEVYPTSAVWDTIWHVERGEIVDIPYWPGYKGLSDQDFVRRASDYNLIGGSYIQLCESDDNPHTDPLFIDVITTLTVI